MTDQIDSAFFGDRDDDSNDDSIHGVDEHNKALQFKGLTELEKYVEESESGNGTPTSNDGNDKLGTLGGNIKFSSLAGIGGLGSSGGGLSSLGGGLSGLGGLSNLGGTKSGGGRVSLSGVGLSGSANLGNISGLSAGRAGKTTESKDAKNSSILSGIETRAAEDTHSQTGLRGFGGLGGLGSTKTSKILGKQPANLSKTSLNLGAEGGLSGLSGLGKSPAKPLHAQIPQPLVRQPQGNLGGIGNIGGIVHSKSNSKGDQMGKIPLSRVSQPLISQYLQGGPPRDTTKEATDLYGKEIKDYIVENTKAMRDIVKLVGGLSDKMLEGLQSVKEKDLSHTSENITLQVQETVDAIIAGIDSVIANGNKAYIILPGKEFDKRPSYKVVANELENKELCIVKSVKQLSHVVNDDSDVDE